MTFLQVANKNCCQLVKKMGFNARKNDAAGDILKEIELDARKAKKIPWKNVCSARKHFVCLENNDPVPEVDRIYFCLGPVVLVFNAPTLKPPLEPICFLLTRHQLFSLSAEW